MKSIRQIVRNVPPHWVGDGFPVRSLFSYQDGNQFDPFLLLDFAGPYEFAPSEAKRGVGEHPHRGFETVTIVYQGEHAMALLLSGQPIGEPVVGRGPFVMNTQEEIRQAFLIINTEGWDDSVEKSLLALKATSVPCPSLDRKTIRTKHGLFWQLDVSR